MVAITARTPWTTTIKVWLFCSFMGYLKAASTGSKNTTYDISGFKYGVVIDAGSSGSRIHVYKWLPRTDIREVPSIHKVYSNKTQPGISSYVYNFKGLEKHIETLVGYAKDHVPRNLHPETSIYVMATAGMRLLLEHKANSIISKIDSLLQNWTANPFRYNHINTRILSGEEEGVFAWITANYRNQFFHDPDRLESVGVLEMGGASTQIVFIPRGSILADKFPVKIAGRIYPLYVHSYLSFGQNYLESRIRQDLYEKNDTLDTIMNPCMLRDDILTTTIFGQEITFIGSGDPEECSDIIDKVVYKVRDPDHCSPKPCAIGSVYQPSIGDQEFVAVSAYCFPLLKLKVVNLTHGSFTPADTTQAAFQYCRKSIEEVKNETGKPDYQFHSTECMMGLYIPVLLVKAYGFSNDTHQLRTVTDSDDLEWPLGALLYENERRNWPCIPPSEEPKVSGLSSSGHSNGLGRVWTILLTSLYIASLVANH